MNASQVIVYANQVAEAARHIPWNAIYASGVISPLLLAIKHWLQIEGSKHYKFLGIPFTGEQVMLGLLAAITTSAATLNYLLHTPTHDPTIIAMQAAILGFMTQPVYFLILKPGIKLFQKQVAKAAQYNLNAAANAKAYESSVSN